MHCRGPIPNGRYRTGRFLTLKEKSAAGCEGPLPALACPGAPLGPPGDRGSSSVSRARAISTAGGLSPSQALMLVTRS
eukprot:jgi/Botrbrau1/17997/Bobra.0713s0004.1